MSWTPEFRAYCAAQGRPPVEQLAHDRRAFPGGCMCGFICWMLKKLAKFRREVPGAYIGEGIWNHDAKVKFLRAEAERDKAAREFWEE